MTCILGLLILTRPKEYRTAKWRQLRTRSAWVVVSCSQARSQPQATQGVALSQSHMMLGIPLVSPDHYHLRHNLLLMRQNLQTRHLQERPLTYLLKRSIRLSYKRKYKSNHRQQHLLCWRYRNQNRQYR